jgi:hypothetical protein
MLENNFLLKLNLQKFADDIDNEDNVNDDMTGIEDELIAAIQKLNSENPSDEDSDDNVDDVDNDQEENEEDIEADEDEEEEDLEDEEEDEETPPATTGKKQSKEENARFAKERREKEYQARLQAEIAELKAESPEFKLAQQLSDMTGKPVDQIMTEMRESALQKEAQEAKVPVEVLRKQREAEEKANELERQINTIRFEQWQSKIKADGEALQKEYSFLTQEDLDSAKSYILNTAKNVDMPLEDAVYAIHGKKIIQNLAKGKVQDELATQSGRKKKTPLAPNTGKAPKSPVSLTADEKAIARAFGMTEEEYHKFK